jgi:hypothetical protein
MKTKKKTRGACIKSIFVDLFLLGKKEKIKRNKNSMNFF